MCLVLVFRNIINFYMLILCSVTLITCLLVLLLFVDSLGIFYINYHISMRVILFFSFWSVFLLYPFLTLLHWLELAVLWWVRMVSKHPCFVPNLSRKAFSLLLLSTKLALVFYTSEIINLRTFPLSSCFSYDEWVLKFVMLFFCIDWYDHVVFHLQPVKEWWLYWLTFQTLNKFCLSVIIHLIMVCILIYYLILYAYIWVRIFAFMFTRENGLY
jgi:hypothetical protein